MHDSEVSANILQGWSNKDTVNVHHPKELFDASTPLPQFIPALSSSHYIIVIGGNGKCFKLGEGKSTKIRVVSAEGENGLVGGDDFYFFVKWSENQFDS